MPTARELLEQADALMRRNRVRAADGDIPVLTDAVGDAAGATASAATEEAAAPPAAPVSEPAPAGPPASALATSGPPAAPAGFDEVPELTEMVEEIDIPSIAVESEPGTVAAAAAGGEASADDDARWHALADEVRLRVLEEVGGFAASELTERLSGRMQPIIDRARTELAAAIDAEVAELIRAHVAGSIEREIERLRARS